MKLKYFLLLIFIIQLSPITTHAQTSQEILQQEQLLKQQNARIERQADRDKLEKEIESEKLDLISNFKIEEQDDDLSLQPQNCFKLKSVTYINFTILLPRHERKLSKPFINKCITPNLLTNITRNVTNFYINKGYVTTRAFVNPQNIKTGGLEVIIMEGKLEKIEFDYDVNQEFEGLGSDNNPSYESERKTERPTKTTLHNLSSKSQILTSFGLLEGKILNIRDIEQGLDQLNRLSSNNAVMKIVPSQKQGYSKIIISKNKKSRITRARLSANNSGQEQTGLYNGKIILEQDNLLKVNDSIYAMYTKNLSSNDSRDSKSFYGSIDIPFGYWNFSTSYIGSSYLNTVQGTNQTIVTTGKSNFKTFKLQRKIFRNKRNKIGLFTSLNLKDTKSFIEDVINDTGSRKLSIMSTGLTHSISSAKIGYINYTLSHVFGITDFGAKEDTGIQDDFIPQAQYKKYTLDVSYYKPFKIKAQNISFQSYFSGQYSEDPLFSSEQIIIGDQYSVRGFRAKSSLGDSGFYIQNNLNYSLPPFIKNKLNITNALQKTELFLGYDYGYVKQKGGADASYGEGKGILQGFATGLRFKGKYLQFDVTYAKTLRTESYIPEGSEIYANITIRVW
jgi:hemolysin activation/secretion protein